MLQGFRGWVDSGGTGQRSGRGQVTKAFPGQAREFGLYPEGTQCYVNCKARESPGFIINLRVVYA